jgi:hypothetical protein
VTLCGSHRPDPIAYIRVFVGGGEGVMSLPGHHGLAPPPNLLRSQVLAPPWPAARPYLLRRCRIRWIQDPPPSASVVACSMLAPGSASPPNAGMLLRRDIQGRRRPRRRFREEEGEEWSVRRHRRVEPFVSSRLFSRARGTSHEPTNKTFLYKHPFLWTAGYFPYNSGTKVKDCDDVHTNVRRIAVLLVQISCMPLWSYKQQANIIGDHYGCTVCKLDLGKIIWFPTLHKIKNIRERDKL